MGEIAIIISGLVFAFVVALGILYLGAIGLTYVLGFIAYIALAVFFLLQGIYKAMVFIFNKMYTLVVAMFKKTPQKRAKQLKENTHQLYLYSKKTYENLKPILAILVLGLMTLS